MLGASALVAAPISIDKAEQIAKQWIDRKTQKSHSVEKKLYSAISTNKTKLKGLNKNYTIVKLQPQGWVVVSLDDKAKSILAYGESKFDENKIPPALKIWLAQANDYIEYKKSIPKLAKNPRRQNKEKEFYGQNDYHYIVRPLLWMGSSSDTEDQGILWDQGQYYNANTPLDANDEHTWVGCVATAMGQIMRYWKYPTVGKGSHCYTPRTHSEYGEQCADFGATAYDWDNMPFKLNSDNDNVATLLYHAGVAVDMN